MHEDTRKVQWISRGEIPRVRAFLVVICSTRKARTQGGFNSTYSRNMESLSLHSTVADEFPYNSIVLNHAELTQSPSPQYARLLTNFCRKMSAETKTLMLIFGLKFWFETETLHQKLFG